LLIISFSFKIDSLCVNLPAPAPVDWLLPLKDAYLPLGLFCHPLLISTPGHAIFTQTVHSILISPAGKQIRIADFFFQIQAGL
jgi:hypothetical protein